MKQTFLRFFAVLLVVMLMLTGCSRIVEEDSTEAMTLYATFYPIYALTQMIVEDIPDLTLNCLVQPQDGCLRSYSLSDWDLYLLAYSADGVVMGGGGLEAFEDVLTSLGESGPALVEVLYGINEIVGTDAASDEDASHWSGENPHAYLSLNAAPTILSNIAASMSVLDARYAEQYEKNLETALEKLDKLKAEVDVLTSDCAGIPTALLSEATAYVAQDYDLDVVVQIERESGEALYGSDLEACIAQIQESGAQLALVELQVPKTLTDALIASGVRVAKMDILSMHRADEGYEGYFEAQRANAQALSDAVQSIKRGGLE